jgi:hypothetical protein
VTTLLPCFSLGGQDNYAFSPELGQEVCYTSNHDKVEAASTNNDLWTVTGEIGRECNLGRCARQDERTSPPTPGRDFDGRCIRRLEIQSPIARRNCRGYESDRFRLVLYVSGKRGKREI